MAEARDTGEALPPKGTVEQVRKEWSVHEDGAMAHCLQNEENNRHYGFNRNQRRTVRSDIPVAKLVQSEEEKRLQEERLRQLQELNALAERDAEIAKRVAEKEKEQIWRKNSIEQDDEAIAKQMQEKEKKKYERYLEKKKEKELKKKRERLEKELAEQSEQARMTQSHDVEDQGTDRLNGSVDRLSLEDTANGHTRYTQRVTPAGQIEDDGDFSDFYALPPGDDNDPIRRHMQETQDEELARLLQEQEHKRNKAEVDKDKLKAIEVQDEELARVIQEQEKLKARKAKIKRQQLKEQQRLQQHQQLPSTEPSRKATEPPLRTPDGSEQPPYQHRYRRDSYTRSISNNSGPVQKSPAAFNDTTQHLSDEEQWYNIPDDNITSARELTRAQELSSGRIPQENYSHKVVQRGQNGVSKSTSRPQEQRHNTAHLPPADSLPDPAVERWLAESVPSRVGARGQSGAVLPPSPSPPGSYHSEEESPESFEHVQRSRLNHAVNNAGSQSFNIAAAIDPTYKRRQHEIDDNTEQTHQKSLAFSRSLPVPDDTEVEWDPAGLRGSLRRPKGQWNPTATNYQESSTLSSLRSDLESPSDGGPVMNPFQPVQGQRRSTLDNRRKASNTGKPSKGGSCKQQ
ncbi:trichohyalin isoform X2 [Patella vulgata]|uniref:trichohyalin isoform X2 n=1 Tax=Patella vulgata TaxID=6465 RepID=UPI0021800C4E|nr:trichohyalin isoform X2 [Patella vulgata]